MPQTNITYDTRYNNDLVKTLREMEKKHFNLNRHQYQPSPMGFRNADSFHHPEKVPAAPQVQLTGGVAPSKYILNGNSPAYPPINMNAGLAVSSGGGRNRYAGVDGAVGGAVSGEVSGGKFKFSDITKGAKDVLSVGHSAAKLAATVAPLMAASGGKFNLGKTLKSVGKAVKTGAEVAKTGKEAYDLYNSVMGGSLSAPTATDIRRMTAFSKKLVGGNWLSDAFKVAKQVAPIALPLMMGAGHSCPKIGDKVAVIERAMKKLQGGSFWKDFGKGFKKGFTGTLDIAKDIAPIAIPLMMAAGRSEYGQGFNMGKFLERQGRTIPQRKGRKGGAMVGAYLGADGEVHHGANVGRQVGGVNLKDAIAFTKSIGSKAVGEVKKRGKAAGKDLLNEVGAAAKKSLKASANAAAKDVVAATGGGRSARAAIVKKVMAERGISMINASKAVKAEGLYKSK